MVKIQGKYINNLKIETEHLDSGAKITTVAPKDNQGDGSCFSPTDLVATALGSCMLTIYAINAEKAGISMEGAYFEGEKHMEASPRRISPLVINLFLPKSIPTEHRTKFEEAMKACPVHKSLNSDIDFQISCNYQ